MADGKKLTTVELSFDPLKEMDKDTAAWISGTKMLQRKFGKYEFKGSVLVDPGKWNEKKLKDELKDIVKYGCKILSVRCMEGHKKAKKDPRFEAAAVAQLPKEYEEIKKELDEALNKKLKDIEEDKGDNRKALRDGKRAMAKFDSVEISGLFKKNAAAASEVLKTLAADLKTADEERKAEEKAYAQACTKLDKIRDDFNSDGDDLEAAVAYLLKIADTMGNDAKADQAIRDFSSENIKPLETDLGKLVKSIKGFREEINDVYNDVSSRNLNPAQVLRKSSEISAEGKHESISSSLAGDLKKLAKAFKAVEAKLK